MKAFVTPIELQVDENKDEEQKKISISFSDQRMTEEFRRETDSWSIVSDEGFNEIIVIDAFAWRKCDIFRTVLFFNI